MNRKCPICGSIDLDGGIVKTISFGQTSQKHCKQCIDSINNTRKWMKDNY